jgi:hypothetical protein
MSIEKQEPRGLNPKKGEVFLFLASFCHGFLAYQAVFGVLVLIN